MMENFIKHIKERTKRKREIDKKIQKMRDEAEEERLLAVEKARLKAQKKQEIKKAKQNPSKGGDIRGAFEGFRDFATEFTKNQQKSKGGKKNERIF